MTDKEEIHASRFKPLHLSSGVSFTSASDICFRRVVLVTWKRLIYSYCTAVTCYYVLILCLLTINTKQVTLTIHLSHFIKVTGGGVE